MNEIRKHITANDIDVLEQSLAFVRERAAYETERGKAAEARATAMLAILGLLAGFVVPLVKAINTVSGDVKWSLIAAFLGSLLFLSKGLYHAVCVLGVARHYRVKVDSIFDIQGLSRTDALREEITWLVWECQRSIQPNTVKLFRLHRCQRSGLVALILFMIFGFLLLLSENKWLVIPQWFGYGVGLSILLLLSFTDLIAEKTGIWGKKRNNSTTSGKETD